MFNVKALEEQQAKLLDRTKAIAKLAADEERELSDDETAEVDRILDSDIPKLQAKIDRAKKIEAEEARLAQIRNEPALTRADGPDDDADADTVENDLAARITIPRACAHRFSTLKCFHGKDAEKRAYISGRFLFATLFGDENSRKWCDDHQVDWRPRAAMGTTNDNLGGALVPEEMEQAIIDLKEMYGVFRREARNVPMMSDTKYQPRRTSGVTAYFVGENPASGVTASDKAWDNVRLVANKLAVLCKYSTEIAEDAIISIADDLTREIAYAFAVKEDACGFLGDASDTYGGIVGLINAIQAGSKVTATTGNTAFSTLDLVDFEEMIGALPTYAEGNAKWYISKAGWAASMMRLADAAGGNTTENIAGGPSTRTFLGYPVVISQTMNSTLTAQTSTDGICYFGDLRQAAMFGNRRGMQILVSPHRYMEFDQIGILGTERFDIVVHEVGDASNAGSIIMLSTPSA